MRNHSNEKEQWGKRKKEINLIQFAYVICVNVWLFNIFQLSFELWFDFKQKKIFRILWPQKSGLPGLSVGDMCHKPLILEIAASALGFPACIAVLEATRGSFTEQRGPETSEKRAPIEESYGVVVVVQLFRRLLEQTTSKKTSKNCHFPS